MEIRGVLLKKVYISPEFDYAQISLTNVVCVSYAETVVDDIIEYDGDDDV